MGIGDAAIVGVAVLGAIAYLLRRAVRTRDVPGACCDEAGLGCSNCRKGKGPSE